MYEQLKTFLYDLELTDDVRLLTSYLATRLCQSMEVEVKALRDLTGASGADLHVACKSAVALVLKSFDLSESERTGTDWAKLAASRLREQGGV